MKNTVTVDLLFTETSEGEGQEPSGIGTRSEKILLKPNQALSIVEKDGELPKLIFRVPAESDEDRRRQMIASNNYHFAIEDMLKAGYMKIVRIIE